MCVVLAAPVAMGIMAATAAASAGVGAYGAIQSSNASAAAANYQSQVAANNAVIAQSNANYAIQAGQDQVGQQQIQTSATIGAQRATAAANGVDPNSGSAMQLQGSAAELGAVNEVTISNNAARQAYGYEVEGMSQTAQAGLDTMQASQDSTAGGIGAFSSILSGASSVSSNYAQWQMRAGSNPAPNVTGASMSGFSFSPLN